MKWSYGVTTVPSRFKELLPRTLASLERAGFDKPRLFIDGCRESEVPRELSQRYDITCRCPRLRTFGNWITTAWELYLREPHAERYAIFQDDFVTYPNLRKYLEACEYPAKGYWNLYTFPKNEKQFQGWYQSNQRGLGAVALVFNGDALRILLQQKHMVERPLNDTRGWRAVDGGIVTAMKEAGWTEYVHNPSLVQHTGDLSSMGNGPQEKAATFRGEDYDAENLLKSAAVARETRRRIGLVGYNCNTGLGELNRQLAEYGDVHTWLVQPHRLLPSNQPHPNVDTIVCPMGHPTKIEKFVKSVDVVVFAERPYYDMLPDYCKKYNRRTVCIPMLEWMTPGGRGWPQAVDLFICPTRQCYDAFSRTVPCVYFPWPIDTQRFQFRPRTVCNEFLFIAGHGGFKGRKGVEVILEAKRLWPEFPIAVRSQVGTSWPEGFRVLPATTSNADLYHEGDVLIAPHSVDGLGLEPMEAMATGMPVVSTDGLPWNEIPSIAKIPATVSKRVVRRPVDWYSPDPAKLVEICKGLLGSKIEESSQVARFWAEERAWENHNEKFAELVRFGKGIQNG